MGYIYDNLIKKINSEKDTNIFLSYKNNNNINNIKNNEKINLSPENIRSKYIFSESNWSNKVYENKGKLSKISK